MIVTERERERGRDTGRGRSSSMHREPDVGFDPGSPGWHPGPKAGAKPLRHPEIPVDEYLGHFYFLTIKNNVVMDIHVLGFL